MSVTIKRTEKRCPRCKETLPVSRFSANRGRPDGLQGWCISCRSASTWGAEFPDFAFYEIAAATRRAATRMAREDPDKYARYVEEELRAARKGGRKRSAPE